MWFMNDFGGWWMWLGAIWMFVFWGGLIALVVWGITKLTKRGDYASKRSPLDMAKERYARGELNKEEFEQIKKDLY